MAAPPLTQPSNGFLEIVLLNILEVLVRAHLDFSASSFIANDDSAVVLLEGRDGPNLSDGTFDGSLQSASLVVAVADDEHFLSVKHCANANGEGRLGHLVYIALEEAAVGDNCIGGEALLTGAALEAGERLVESDVAVGTNTAHEEVDTASSLDGSFVGSALCYNIFCVTIEDVYVLLLDVDMAEEVVPHEAVVAFGMLFGQTYIFVHVEGDNIFEAHLTGLVKLNEVLVEAQRTTASGATQHERLLGSGVCGVNATCYILGGPNRKGSVIRLNNYSHFFRLVFKVE